MAITNELLQKMNGFGVSGNKRIMIAATNRPDQIDPAYLRFKRFSYQLYIELPDREAMEAIVKSKIPSIGLADDISISEIVDLAMKAGNLSAADICNIIESACMYAINFLQAKGLKKPIPLTRYMIMKSFENNPSHLTKDALQMYQDFKVQK
jgi:SpoVK/Ycf46/Vps4 family AAA+-type ATPase